MPINSVCANLLDSIPPESYFKIKALQGKAEVLPFLLDAPLKNS